MSLNLGIGAWSQARPLGCQKPAQDGRERFGRSDTTLRLLGRRIAAQTHRGLQVAGKLARLDKRDRRDRAERDAPLLGAEPVLINPNSGPAVSQTYAEA